MVTSKGAAPADLLVLTSEAQVRAYLHPVRHRMLQFLSAEPLTASQVAERLRVHPANLTHHFRALRSGRLIRLVEERDIGRVVEKYYRAVARRFEVRADGAAQLRGAGARALGMLEADLRAVSRALPRGERELVVHLQNARLPEGAFEGFARELASLAAKWRTTTENPEGGRWYSLGLALYPREPHLLAPDAEPTARRRKR